MFDDLVEYVRENYSRAAKIVEVGVGSRIEVAEKIKKSLPLAEVLVTDKDEGWVRQHTTSQIRAVADDVRFPQTPLYENSSLLYSIHPPFEIVEPMVLLARRIKADLLVVPRSDEQESFHQSEWEKLVRNGRTLGWLRIHRREHLQYRTHPRAHERNPGFPFLCRDCVRCTDISGKTIS